MDKGFQAVKIDSTASDRQNISFKFTKTSSKTLSGNRLEDDSKDYVLSVAKSEIKSATPKEKERDLVIPLIRKNNWRISDANAQDTGDKDSQIKELAIQELLKETSEKNEKWEKREFKNYTVTIPLIMQNKIPDGFETDEKMDVSLRPEESKLEDYEKVPVEQYGLAMLRGMGWKEGDPIGANSSKTAEPVQVQLRPKGLGLGADVSALKIQEKKSDEKLDLVKGSYVNIVQGSHKGCYGEVLGLDEENARVIVKLNSDEKIQTFPEFCINVVSKKEYDKEIRVINKTSYENYKKDKEYKVKQEQHSESRNSDKKHISKEHNKRKTAESDSPKEKNSDKRHKSSKKRHHSREKSVEKQISSSGHKSTKSWVRPQLRVRLIDDKYKKGKYFNMKLVVVDVLAPRRCICKTDDDKCLDDISPSMLETVIPRNESDYVMIVKGEYSGELCTILKKDKSKCIATVQLLSDRNQALKIEYDSICEYVGDISQFD